MTLRGEVRGEGLTAARGDDSHHPRRTSSTRRRVHRSDTNFDSISEDVWVWWSPSGWVTEADSPARSKAPRPSGQRDKHGREGQARQSAAERQLTERSRRGQFPFRVGLDPDRFACRSRRGRVVGVRRHRPEEAVQLVLRGCAPGRPNQPIHSPSSPALPSRAQPTTAGSERRS